MASLAAVQLRKKIEGFLGRGLTIRQVQHCEELVVNFKPGFPERFLEGLSSTLEASRCTMRNWGIFYFPLYAMAKSFRGYARRDDFYFLRGRLHRIYRECDLMAGDGFGEKDLAAILFLADECSDGEIHAATTIARTYGLRTIRHLRGIILSNRARAFQPHLQSFGLDKDEKLCTLIGTWAAAKYPDVSMLRQLYRTRAESFLRKKKSPQYSWDWDHLNNSKEIDDEKEKSTGY